MEGRTDGGDDFVSFYRGYARSGIHATAAALLTLFGLLASVAGHWAFVGVGVVIYLIPPVYLYAVRGSAGADVASAGTGSGGDEGGGSGSGSGVEPTRDGPDSDALGPAREDTTDAVDGPPDASRTSRADREPSGGWGWRPLDPPTDADLVGAAAAADGTYAAGADGTLLARREGDWETVLEDGAGGDGNGFTAVDATPDGRAVWAVGDGGAVARVDADRTHHADLSAPNDLTSTWTGVAVAGPAGEETIYLANGSGVVLRGVMVDGTVTWGEGVKPGSGSSVADLDFAAPKRGVVCDTAGGVFETLDGDAFERVGIDDPGGTPTAVIAGDGTREGPAGGARDGDGGVPGATVAADDGSLHGYDRGSWTRQRPTDAALFGLARGRSERLAVGDGGTILADSGEGWATEPAPVDAPLRGAALLADGTALAVGDGGTAVERRSATGTDR